MHVLPRNVGSHSSCGHDAEADRGVDADRPPARRPVRKSPAIAKRVRMDLIGFIVGLFVGTDQRVPGGESRTEAVIPP